MRPKLSWEALRFLCGYRFTYYIRHTCTLYIVFVYFSLMVLFASVGALGQFENKSFDRGKHPLSHNTTSIETQMGAPNLTFFINAATSLVSRGKRSS